MWVRAVAFSDGGGIRGGGQWRAAVGRIIEQGNIDDPRHAEQSKT